MARGSRVVRVMCMAGQTNRLAFRGAVVTVAGKSRCGLLGREERQPCDGHAHHDPEPDPRGADRHGRMVLSPPMRRETVRDIVLYPLLTVVLGAAANLLPSRHLPWWGRGQLPPTVGTDFQWIDVTSAETLRETLPSAVFLDTRNPTQFLESHVPGAVPLSYSDLKSQLTKTLLDRLRLADAIILVGETEEADVEQLLAQELRLRGLAPPHIVQGGFPAWQAAGLAVQGGRP